MRSPRHALLTIVVALALSSCASSGSGAPTAASRDAAAAAIARAVIVPGYERLRNEVAALDAAVVTLCLSPSSALLEKARVQWRATIAAFWLTRPYRFGPTPEMFNLSKVHYPSNPDKVAELLGASDPLVESSLIDLGADQRGLGAVEILLFADDTVSDRECQYVQSAMRIISTAASDVAQRWAATTVATKDVIDNTVNGMVFTLVEVEARLGKATGFATGTPAPAEVEAGPAGNARNDLASLLAGCNEILTADASVLSLLTAVSPQAAKRVAKQMAAAQDATAAIRSPLTAPEAKAPMGLAHESARTLLVTVRTEVSGLLGVTVRLGAADGDS